MNIGKMEQEEIFDLVLHYDERVNGGLSTEDQIAFLTHYHQELGYDYDLIRNPANNRVCRFNPRDTLFRYSNQIWILYAPYNIIKVSLTGQAVLAQIGRDYPEAPSTYATIISSTATLPPETRALFCAARMNGFAWNESSRFFYETYQLLDLRAQKLNLKRPEYPRAFCPKRFYRALHPSYVDALPDALRKAIGEDVPPRFSITLSICNKKLSSNLFLYLIRNEAKNILLANLQALKQFIPFTDLVLFSASSLHPRLALPLLNAMEAAEPGVIRNAADIFGNNALWYLLYRKANTWNDPGDGKPIEKALLESGCDPNQPNCLKLSYSDIVKAKEVLQSVL